MENTVFIEKIAHLEEQNKSNTKRIDEHDERKEKLEDTYSTLQKMDYRIGKLETSIEKVDEAVPSPSAKVSALPWSAKRVEIAQIAPITARLFISLL